MTPGEAPDYLAINREAWTRKNAEHTDAHARENWAEQEITWGIWEVPEAELGTLPERDLRGKAARLRT